MGYAKITAAYDNRGNKIEQAYFGKDGKPTLQKNGVAKTTTANDEWRNPFAGALSKSLKSSHARVTWAYDDRGNVIEEAYFDTDGKLTRHKSGYVETTLAYDEQGNKIEQSFFGADGKLTRHKDGYAKVKRSYDNSGNIIEEAYFGTDGEPTRHKDRYAKVTWAYEHRNNVEKD